MTYTHLKVFVRIFSYTVSFSMQEAPATTFKLSCCMRNATSTKPMGNKCLAGVAKSCALPDYFLVFSRWNSTSAPRTAAVAIRAPDGNSGTTTTPLAMPFLEVSWDPLAVWSALTVTAMW